MKLDSIFGGSVMLFTALLSGALMLSAPTSYAEPLPLQAQQPAKSAAEAASGVVIDTATQTGSLGEASASDVKAVAPPSSYVATAYSLRGRTASGMPVSKGLIAADPRFLPLGSRVRLEAGAYSGEYLVADTGGSVRGRRIDIWTPSSQEAMRFGKRNIKLTVLSWGRKHKAAH